MHTPANKHWDLGGQYDSKHLHETHGKNLSILFAADWLLDAAIAENMSDYEMMTRRLVRFCKWWFGACTEA